MFTLHINGQPRSIPLQEPLTLEQILQHLAIKPDRVAVEHNGSIVSRKSWNTTPISPNDRLEIVHFVGGGAL
jgi:sulfur carrier protein